MSRWMRWVACAAARHTDPGQGFTQAILRFEVDDNHLRLFEEGILVLDVVDGTFTAGYAGIFGGKGNDPFNASLFEHFLLT